ncbi:hypothetical protein IC229_24995 [Spirosoma sp. BT702]|uniref:Uncharacterized protein n=1 Tax=Spirosoma profusum TaxID=2771354 RepID=A0A926Y523_9BACT|nr:hypothetical protein [Spirosoma profusum]MBD2703926.1 hypothetical protein [Spirosoma profusum]
MRTEPKQDTAGVAPDADVAVDVLAGRYDLARKAIQEGELSSTIRICIITPGLFTT